MPRKYVVIDSSDVSQVDFSKVLETSEDTLRWSVDGSQTFVKFEGAIPDFLVGKTQLTYGEMLNLLESPTWVESPNPFE
tara:strand:+ start:2222 stop:2458 length:237 start_codon:yes stop_codon:yes gene_type:complete